MTINVSEALDSDTCVMVTVERKTPGAFVDGIFQPGTISTFKTLASPQQPSPIQMQNLPSGERDNDIKMFICKRKVRTTDSGNNIPADIILFEGERYKVIQLADWSTFGHNIAYGARQ